VKVFPLLEVEGKRHPHASEWHLGCEAG